MYTTSFEAQDGVNLGTVALAVQRMDRPIRERTGGTTASNLDTHLDRGVGRVVRMLLSFQRPSHLFQKGFPSQGHARGPIRIPGADRRL